MGYSIDANGWSVFTVSSNGFGEGSGYSGSGTRIIYCNPATGSDSNDGSFTASGGGVGPVATPAHGLSLLRSGSPDWLLLAKGQTWNVGFGTFSKYGLDANNYMVVSSYDPTASHSPPIPNPYTGGNRPEIDLAPANGVMFSCQGGIPNGNFLALVGIKFYAYTRDPGNVGNFSPTDAQNGSGAPGYSMSGATNSSLIEDCWIGFFAEGLDIETADPSWASRFSNLVIRRNQLVNSYCTTFDSSGLLTGPVSNGPTGFVVYQNLFDHNGWNPSVSGAGASGFNHNFYLNGFQANGDPTLSLGQPPTMQENIICNEGAGGQFRNNGVITYNLFIQEALPFAMHCPEAFTGSITNNVILNGVNSAVSGAGALELGSRYIDENVTVGNTNITNNIIAHCPVYPSGTGIILDEGTNGNSVSSNIIYNWSTSNSTQALVSFTGSIASVSITNAGSLYTDSSTPISAAGPASNAGAGGLNNVVLTVGNTINFYYTPVYVTGGAAAGIPDGIYFANSGTTVDAGGDTTHLMLAGTSTMWNGSTFTGTVYFPWASVPLTGGSGTGASCNLISKGGQIVYAWLNSVDLNVNGFQNTSPGQNYVVSPTPDVLSATPVAGPNDGLSGHFANGTGSGLQLTVTALASNTIGTNSIDTGGTNNNGQAGQPWPDPNRSAGSYYATLPGATANATFTGSISAGVLTVSNLVGTLNLGDAINWGQAKADYIFSQVTGTTGSNGTYNLASKTGTAPASAGSQPMNSYTAQQLINLMRNQSKATWNTALTSKVVNQYIAQGFGLNWASALPAGRSWLGRF